MARPNRGTLMRLAKFGGCVSSCSTQSFIARQIQFGLKVVF
jgi:hypothetical protein